MKNSQKRALSILLAMAFLIGSIMVYVYFLSPAYDEAQSQKARLLSKEKSYNDTKAIIDQSQNLFSLYQNSGKVQENVSAILPASPMISQALYQLNGIADASGMKIQSMGIKEMAITPSPDPSIIKGLGTIRFSGQVAGTYEAFRSFLSNTESNMRIFNMNSLRVEKAGAAANSDLFNFNFEADAYYQTN